MAELVAVGRVLIDADPHRKTRANEIAQRLLTHAIELAPDSASAHYNYGRALRQSSIKPALAEWEKALALDPGDELRLQILIKIGAAKLISRSSRLLTMPSSRPWRSIGSFRDVSRRPCWNTSLPAVEIATCGGRKLC